jgi:anaerobic ribonucleoside-triphosphate reductase activating protein
MKLALSRVHFPVTTLGPGRRVGIWLQGCSIRCPGCISADTWAHREPNLEVSAALECIEPWLDECEGVTISGGEPFDQVGGLLALLQAIRARCSADVLVYSGYSFEHIREQPVVSSGLIDALITDPYLAHMPQTKALRGSDNQRLHCLTPLGKQVFASAERETSGRDKRLDVMFDEDGSVWLAGIPQRGDMERLQVLMREQGHKIHTTEART